MGKNPHFANFGVAKKGKQKQKHTVPRDPPLRGGAKLGPSGWSVAYHDGAVQEYASFKDAQDRKKVLTVVALLRELGPKGQRVGIRCGREARRETREGRLWPRPLAKALQADNKRAMVAFSNHRKETIMAKRITDLMTHGELVAQEELQDEEFREEWARLAFARAVAAKVIEYRADHDLSQRDLAERIGLPQPQIARLEAAEHEPGDKTLCRLAGALGMEFVKSYAPEYQEPKLLTKRAREGAVAAPTASNAVTRFSIA